MAEDNTPTWSYIVQGLKNQNQLLSSYQDSKVINCSLNIATLIDFIETKTKEKREKEQCILENWPKIRRVIKVVPYAIFNFCDVMAKLIYNSYINQKVNRIFISIFILPLLGFMNVLSIVPLFFVRPKTINVLKETSVWILNSICCLFSYFVFDILYNINKLNYTLSNVLNAILSSVLFLSIIFFAKWILSKFELGRKIVKFIKDIVIYIINANDN